MSERTRDHVIEITEGESPFRFSVSNAVSGYVLLALPEAKKHLGLARCVLVSEMMMMLRCKTVSMCSKRFKNNTLSNLIDQPNR